MGVLNSQSMGFSMYVERPEIWRGSSPRYVYIVSKNDFYGFLLSCKIS